MGANDRFKDAVWVTPQDVIVGGAGGIGSWLSLFLSRIGYTVNLYDDDVFEEHNMSGQFVSRAFIGAHKVRAIRELSEQFGGAPMETKAEKYTDRSMAHEFMIAGFDNMKARKVMFENWYNYNMLAGNSNALFIDGRLAFEHIQIICVTPSKTKHYREKHLFADEEVEENVCTLKQTTHVAALIASLMTGFFTNHIFNIETGQQARNVPFEFEFLLPLNMQSDVINY